MLPAGSAERLADLRGVVQSGAHTLILHVEDAQGRRRPLLPRILVEDVVVLVEPLRQARDVGGAALSIADRIELQPVFGHTKPAQQLRVELDQLGVECGVVGADRLERSLVVLAVAALLRRGVAVDRRDCVQLLRLRLAMQAMFEIGPADGRRCVSAQGQRAATPILEGVHLLLYDVRTCARSTREELGVLEDRSLDASVAVEGAEAVDLARDALPERLFGRQDVVRPARRLELRAHEARSSARNGLPTSSSPSVVVGPWPG